MRSVFMVSFAFIVSLLISSVALAQDDLELGQQAYNNCMGCHQQSGEGIIGAFPSLKGHVPRIVMAEGGRTYIINQILYGLQGEVTVLGQSYNSVMPAWAASLSDAQIAAVLNFVATNWGNSELFTEATPFEPFSAAEVAPFRENALSAEQVYELRPEIDPDN